MEKELKKMFEYQRFARNKRIDNLLSNAEKDLNVLLDDSDLSLVAGGTGDMQEKDKDIDKENK